MSDYGKRLAQEGEKFDLVGAIMAFEDGSLPADDTLDLFSHLVRTGQAWSLQGSYGRAAASLIDAGYIERGTGNILKRLGEEE